MFCIPQMLEKINILQRRGGGQVQATIRQKAARTKLARVASAQSKFDSTQVEAKFLAAAVSKRLATRAPDRFLLHRHILGKDITVPLA